MLGLGSRRQNFLHHPSISIFVSVWIILNNYGSCFIFMSSCFLVFLHNFEDILFWWKKAIFYGLSFVYVGKEREKKRNEMSTEILCRWVIKKTENFYTLLEGKLLFKTSSTSTSSCEWTTTRSRKEKKTLSLRLI